MSVIDEQSKNRLYGEERKHAEDKRIIRAAYILNKYSSSSTAAMSVIDEQSKNRLYGEERKHAEDKRIIRAAYILNNYSSSSTAAMSVIDEHIFISPPPPSFKMMIFK